MKTHLKAFQAGILLAALLPFAAAAYAADAATPQNAAPAPETPLHEIGAAPAVTPTPTPTPTPSGRHYHDDGRNRVRFNGSAYVGPDETVNENAVAINGDLTVEGTVEGNGVAVLGSTKINGTVEGNGVAVLGSTTVNGTVRGNAVAVMGNLRLGPNARVDGNAVSVGGDVIKDPTATVGGEIVPVSFGVDPDNSPEAHALWRHGFMRGRPLAFGPHLHVFWIATLCMVAIYILLALIFPNGIRKCADTLQHRPGITVLTGFLAMLGLPVLFILLCFTIIGIPVAFVVLPLGVLACLTFGKTALYSLVGRTIVGRAAQPALAVLVGVAVVLVLYVVPLLGLALLFLVSFLGFSCALTTLFTSRSPAPAAVAPAAIPPVAPAQAAAAAGEIAAVAAAAPEAAPVLPPGPPFAAPAAVPAPPSLLPPQLGPAAEALLPKAGFWIRMVALMIDAILVGIVTHMGDWFLPVLALYGALLWHLKGSTIGGIIFGLKVVRIDGKPSEWVTMAVRALACFFSLIVVGLGFFWIAFDPQKQAWHDKIAGTVVVRVPKGVSLV
jgi:uncharacterized RDD family membrane protein YckC/cytoskeletal protein CcmA (bactofilin family)